MSYWIVILKKMDPDSAEKNLLNVIVIQSKTFECDQCGRFYTTKGSLRTHKYNHKKSQQTSVGSTVKDMQQQED